jgi:hypothetical protein|tara:strand:- start:353 stop:982 length:630 start_codon:yes stop_codon:yes gene_type:complete
MAARKGKKGGTKGKGPSKNKSQEAKVASAMKSINNNRTPLSSLLPTQKMGSFRTSDKKGDRAFKSFGPSKVLLATTNPGSRPSAPSLVANPSGVKTGNPSSSYIRSNRLRSYTAKGWDNRNPDYSSEYGAYQTAVRNFNAYNSADNAYRNETLPNYETALSEFNKSSNKNTSKSSEYTKDLATFFNQKAKPKSQSSGARNVSSGRGSRR